MMVVTVAVVVTLYIRIVAEITGYKGLHRTVGITFYAAVELYTGLREGRLSTAAYAAADEHFGTERGKKTCKRAVPAAHGIHHLAGGHFAVFKRVEFELLCMTKMLKHLAVFISYCYFHN